MVCVLAQYHKKKSVISCRSDAPGKMQFEKQIFSANINNYRVGKDLLNRLTFQRPILKQLVKSFSKYSSNLAVLAFERKGDYLLEKNVARLSHGIR